MLDYITINASITPEAATAIRTESKFTFIHRAVGDVFTNELQKAGIIQVSVWVAPSGLYLDSYSTINATIRAQRFFANGAYDFSPVIGLIESYLPLDKIGRLEWKLQSASFVYCFIGSRIKDYYDFLQRGRDLKNRHLKKIVEFPKSTAKSSSTSSNLIKSSSGKTYRLSFSSIHRQGKKNTSKGIPKELLRGLKPEEQKAIRREERPIYDSVGLEFELSYDESTVHACKADIAYIQKKVKENRLSFRAKLKKAKIRPLCKKFEIQGRSLFQFQEKISQIDEYILTDYIGKIVGTGRHYKFYDAEKIVQQSEQFKTGQKQRMCYALKGVAQYKGIDKFLNRAADKSYAPAYEYMLSFKSRASALTALRDLETLCISPLTLSVRKKDVVPDSLTNLIDVFHDAIHADTSAAVVAQDAQPQPMPEAVQQNTVAQAIPADISPAPFQQLPIAEEEDIEEELMNSGFQEERVEWWNGFPDDEDVEKEVWYGVPDDEDYE